MVAGFSPAASEREGQAAPGLHLPDLLIRGFRGIGELAIPRLGRATLLAGRNGAGKSTVLEAVRVYAARGGSAALSGLLRDRDEIFPPVTGAVPSQSPTGGRCSTDARFPTACASPSVRVRTPTARSGSARLSWNLNKPPVRSECCPGSLLDARVSMRCKITFRNEEAAPVPYMRSSAARLDSDRFDAQRTIRGASAVPGTR